MHARADFFMYDQTIPIIQQNTTASYGNTRNVTLHHLRLEIVEAGVSPASRGRPARGDSRDGCPTMGRIGGLSVKSLPAAAQRPVLRPEQMHYPTSGSDSDSDSAPSPMRAAAAPSGSGKSSISTSGC